jgi:toxin ParE1/3/4
VSRITFTDDAIQDLQDIYDYIAEDNIDAAADLHQEKLHQRWLPLIDQPRMGRKRDEIRSELRSITEDDYIIYYQIVRDGVLIVRILHGSRDPKRAFSEHEK